MNWFFSHLDRFHKRYWLLFYVAKFLRSIQSFKYNFNQSLRVSLIYIILNPKCTIIFSININYIISYLQFSLFVFHFFSSFASPSTSSSYFPFASKSTFFVLAFLCMQFCSDSMSNLR